MQSLSPVEVAEVYLVIGAKWLKKIWLPGFGRFLLSLPGGGLFFPGLRFRQWVLTSESYRCVQWLNEHSHQRAWLIAVAPGLYRIISDQDHQRRSRLWRWIQRHIIAGVTKEPLSKQGWPALAFVNAALSMAGFNVLLFMLGLPFVLSLLAGHAPHELHVEAIQMLTNISAVVNPILAAYVVIRMVQLGRAVGGNRIV
jgi:hypothetical protein